MLFLAPILCLLSSPSFSDGDEWQKNVKDLAKSGAVLVEGGQKGARFSLNSKRPLIPASILKIVTASGAIHSLGLKYRYTTEFRLSPENDLHVAGKGDPLLVSEEIERIAHALKAKGMKSIRHILLDDSYFEKGLILHGTNRSLNPYDAFNGALCVNFNSINVRIGPGDRVSSVEPQTPMTPLAKQMALKSGLWGEVRMNLAESPEKCLIYSGELIAASLKKAAIDVQGRVIMADRGAKDLPLYYIHRSQWDLADLLTKMFKYSNNFMANQIFLTIGAERYGPPATAEKSRRAMNEFFKTLGITPFHMEEGSGLSRRTRVTARQVMAFLHYFRPHLSLLSHEGNAWFKTGSLRDVKSMAGYLTSQEEHPLSFVIMLNGRHVKSHTRDRILKILQSNLP
jgi:D-alanyl-D-alanine carboxypeptidase/D-alanyl-D-alanine-endopeptidase (penicillin-binding protein 4)